MFTVFPNIGKYIPTKIFYLKLDTNKCHNRVTLRDRKGEEDIKMEFLDDCSKYYDKWLNQTPIKYRIVNVNECDLDQIKTSFLKFLYDD